MLHHEQGVVHSALLLHRFVARIVAVSLVYDGRTHYNYNPFLHAIEIDM